MSKPNAAKFWAAGSDSGSEASSDDESEESVVQQRTGKFAMSDSSSDSEGEARVVRSQKDRAWDAIRDIVVRIKNARKNEDWSIFQDEFDAVNKKIDKSKMLIMRDGLPKFYIKMLAEVEDTINEVMNDKEAFKKLKSAAQYALKRMKLTVKKHNGTYETQIAAYRANPDDYKSDVEKDDDSSDDDDSDSDEEDDDDEDSDKSDEDSVFKDDSSDDESLDDRKQDDGRPELKGRARWLKKPDQPDAVKKVAPTFPSATAGAPAGESRKQLLEKPLASSAAAATTVKRAVEVITEEILDKKIIDYMASRGRKQADPRELLRQLEVLAKAARLFGPRKEIPVIMHLISAMYEAHQGIDDYLELKQWRNCFRCLTRITALLHANPDIVLGLMPSEDVTDLVLASQINSDLMKRKDATGEASDDVPKSDAKSSVLRVVGNLESFVNRLEDEYTKSLQQINPHTQDYVIRLSDEASLIELADAVSSYYIRVGNYQAASNVCLMHVEHMYYKHDTVAAAVQRAHVFNKTWGRYGDLHPASTSKKLNVSELTRDPSKVHPAAYLGYPTVEPPPFNTEVKLDELCKFIFHYGNERCKTRGLLCSVFHHALHDRYYRARDLFLISHIQDQGVIDNADTSTKILYNRALAALGLSAFRQGLIQKSHDCLSGICAGRVRELLAQGQARFHWHDRDPEQERIERRRQMPYHMHINPDLLDCCHLTCAMLLELPNMARDNLGSMQGVISRQFRKYLQTYNRQVFTGPPESTREHVLAAAKSLVAGDWQKARDYITGLEVWNLIPNDGGEKVKEMLAVRIKEEAVRTYIFTGASAYYSLSLAHLCETFDMDATNVRRIISRMIFNKETSASWEHPADTLILHKTDPTQLQTLSLNVAEKVSSLVDSNERLLDPFAGGVYGGQKENDWSRDGQRRTPYGNRDGDGQGGRGGRGGRGGGRGGPYEGRGGGEGRGRGRGRGEGRYEGRGEGRFEGGRGRGRGDYRDGDRDGGRRERGDRDHNDRRNNDGEPRKAWGGRGNGAPGSEPVKKAWGAN